MTNTVGLRTACVLKIKNGGYKPLIEGLLASLEPHLDLGTLEDDDGFIDGLHILSLFRYQTSSLYNNSEHRCVCGHRIKNLFWITSPQCPEPVLVGICCVRRFTNNHDLVDKANAAMKRKTDLQRFENEPEVRCVCCGKKRISHCTIAHDECCSFIIPLLLEMSKPTKFIISLRQRRRLTDSQVSALTRAKFWTTAQRTAIFKRYNAYT